MNVFLIEKKKIKKEDHEDYEGVKRMDAKKRIERRKLEQNNRMEKLVSGRKATAAVGKKGKGQKDGKNMKEVKLN